jgi:hypothetical protein
VQFYDYVVIGGGIFGIYTALHLAKRRASVLLIEKDTLLFQRASAINQARLHGGYHYPRSVATARVAHEYKAKFLRDHMPMVNRRFKQYYGIDKNSSFTSSDQFATFCNYLDIPLREVATPDYFRAGQFDGIYLAEEYSFDPVQLAAWYVSKITSNPQIRVLTNSTIESVASCDDQWELVIRNRLDPQTIAIKTKSVINATYSSINIINRLFGLQSIGMIHEIAEVIIASSPLQGVGLTVIDGDFASLMPYGLSDLISLSSVRYTSHHQCEGDFPKFSCQTIARDCRPEACQHCNNCEAKPRSNQVKMMHQIGKYLSSDIKLKYVNSLFTIKSKLKSSYIDDSRPTIVRKLRSEPDFYCIFGGKISSVYEIESHFNV